MPATPLLLRRRGLRPISQPVARIPIPGKPGMWRLAPSPSGFALKVPKEIAERRMEWSRTTRTPEEAAAKERGFYKTHGRQLLEDQAAQFTRREGFQRAGVLKFIEPNGGEYRVRPGNVLTNIVLKGTNKRMVHSTAEARAITEIDRNRNLGLMANRVLQKAQFSQAELDAIRQNADLQRNLTIMSQMRREELERTRDESLGQHAALVAALWEKNPALVERVLKTIVTRTQHGYDIKS